MANQPGAPGLPTLDLSLPTLAPRAAAATTAPAAPYGAAQPAAAAPAEVAEIVEPVDEVLQQVAEQTLHMNHLEAAMRDLAQGISDLGDSTQAGLVEVRGLAAQAAGRAAGEGGSDWQRALGERIDELEAAAARSATKQMILLVVAGLQLAALLFALAVETGAVSFKKKSEEFTFSPPPAAAAQPSPSVQAPLPPLPEPSTPPKDAKGKRRTRH